jgi:hypothetical protein
MSDLLAKGDKVVRGDVAETDAALGDDGLIWTTVTLDVDETLERSNQAQVVFRIPGGTVDGLSLTVPGAPRFKVGQSVLVFLDGDRLLGFGQGAFLVEDGVAFRGLGNALTAEPARTPVKRLIGDEGAAQECLRTRALADYEQGWSLRGSTMTRMAANDERAFAMNLYSGVEYNLRACGDDQAGPLDIVVYDDAGREVVWEVGDTREVGVRFTPEDSGTYYVAVLNESVSVEAFRTSVGLSISYR